MSSDRVALDVKVMVKIGDGKTIPPFTFTKGFFVPRADMDRMIDYTALELKREKDGTVAQLTPDQIKVLGTAAVLAGGFHQEVTACQPAKTKRKA